jgi:hypothetical protein
LVFSTPPSGHFLPSSNVWTVHTKRYLTTLMDKRGWKNDVGLKHLPGKISQPPFVFSTLLFLQLAKCSNLLPVHTNNGFAKVLKPHHRSDRSEKQPLNLNPVLPGLLRKALVYCLCIQTALRQQCLNRLKHQHGDNLEFLTEETVKGVS